MKKLILAIIISIFLIIFLFGCQSPGEWEPEPPLSPGQQDLSYSGALGQVINVVNDVQFDEEIGNQYSPPWNTFRAVPQIIFTTEDPVISEDGTEFTLTGKVDLTGEIQGKVLDARIFKFGNYYDEVSGDFGWKEFRLNGREVGSNGYLDGNEIATFTITDTVDRLKPVAEKFGENFILSYICYYIDVNEDGELKKKDDAIKCGCRDDGICDKWSIQEFNVKEASDKFEGEQGLGEPEPPNRFGDPDVCGNGVVDPGEECDDGNIALGDGCDDNCKLEIVEQIEAFLGDIVCVDNDEVAINPSKVASTVLMGFPGDEAVISDRCIDVNLLGEQICAEIEGNKIQQEQEIDCTVDGGICEEGACVDKLVEEAAGAKVIITKEGDKDKVTFDGVEGAFTIEVDADTFVFDAEAGTPFVDYIQASATAIARTVSPLPSNAVIGSGTGVTGITILSNVDVNDDGDLDIVDFTLVDNR